MHLAGDGPEPRPAPEPEPPVPTQHLAVTPENVVELAVLFRRCATVLSTSVHTSELDLYLEKPWLGDPVSEWAWEAFNKYFLGDADTSFRNVIHALHGQLTEMADALVAAASRYGLDDELNAAMISVGGPR
ncbi:MAG TPA: hypothetical protein VHH15_04990 [Actinophytocola sp.]|nr:hypothetical protein [Actinophytocola sp.]